MSRGQASIPRSIRSAYAVSAAKRAIPAISSIGKLSVSGSFHASPLRNALLWGSFVLNAVLKSFANPAETRTDPPCRRVILVNNVWFENIVAKVRTAIRAGAHAGFKRHFVVAGTGAGIGDGGTGF